MAQLLGQLGIFLTLVPAHAVLEDDVEEQREGVEGRDHHPLGQGASAHPTHQNENCTGLAQIVGQL
jgi:hypothetical protein